MHARLPGNLNLGLQGIDSRPLLSSLKGIAVSVGSACSSDNTEVSYVIQALDSENSLPPATLRLSVGRFTTECEIEQAASEIITVVRNLRDKNPKGGRRTCRVTLFEEHK